VQELENKCNETTASLDRMMEQRELILQKYNEGFYSSFIIHVFGLVLCIASFLSS
jgi:hypothetical protein